MFVFLLILKKHFRTFLVSIIGKQYWIFPTLAALTYWRNAHQIVLATSETNMMNFLAIFCIIIYFWWPRWDDSNRWKYFFHRWMYKKQLNIRGFVVERSKVPKWLYITTFVYTYTWTKFMCTFKSEMTRVYLILNFFYYNYKFFQIDCEWIYKLFENYSLSVICIVSSHFHLSLMWCLSLGKKISYYSEVVNSKITEQSEHFVVVGYINAS